MFINFSNHPSKLWAEDERNAALQYGTIEDLAFPQVPANMSTDGVRKLAEEYAEKILAKKPDCVMCQGEFCLSWHVIARLKEAGVRVAAACSERIVEEVYGVPFCTVSGVLKKSSGCTVRCSRRREINYRCNFLSIFS